MKVYVTLLLVVVTIHATHALLRVGAYNLERFGPTKLSRPWFMKGLKEVNIDIYSSLFKLYKYVVYTIIFMYLCRFPPTIMSCYCRRLQSQLQQNKLMLNCTSKCSCSLLHSYNTHDDFVFFGHNII